MIKSRGDENMQKVFILEDDSKCFGVIDWLKMNNTVKHVKNIEGAVTFFEFEDGLSWYDKMIFDASLPASMILHKDENEMIEYNEALNGIDLLYDNFERWELDKIPNRIAILTAFDNAVSEYSKMKKLQDRVCIISKNSNDLIREIQKFLDM